MSYQSPRTLRRNTNPNREHYVIPEEFRAHERTNAELAEAKFKGCLEKQTSYVNVRRDDFKHRKAVSLDTPKNRFEKYDDFATCTHHEFGTFKPMRKNNNEYSKSYENLRSIKSEPDSPYSNICTNISLSDDDHSLDYADLVFPTPISGTPAVQFPTTDNYTRIDIGLTSAVHRTLTDHTREPRKPNSSSPKVTRKQKHKSK